MNTHREQYGKTFDPSAALYERVRPSYPEELIDDIVNISGLPSDGRILEIGCGTGKATEPFARKGYSLDCLDIGPDLAAIAAEKFKDFNDVQVNIGSFETWNNAERAYNLIIAAASFHWIDPQIRFIKSADMLGTNGALAVFTNKHVRKDEGFFARVQDVYQTHAPSMDQIRSERKKLWTEPVPGEDLFEKPIVKKYPWVVEYSAEDYVGLLGTYSDHLSLPDEQRSSLFNAIDRLIQNEYAGSVQMHYMAELKLWMKKPNKVPHGSR